MSLYGIPNLEAPLVIIAVINNLSEQLLAKTSAIRIGKAINTYVGTFSCETPSRLSEVASGH